METELREKKEQVMGGREKNDKGSFAGKGDKCSHLVVSSE